MQDSYFAVLYIPMAQYYVYDKLHEEYQIEGQQDVANRDILLADLALEGRKKSREKGGHELQDIVN